MLVAFLLAGALQCARSGSRARAKPRRHWTPLLSLLPNLETSLRFFGWRRAGNGLDLTAWLGPAKPVFSVACFGVA